MKHSEWTNQRDDAWRAPGATVRDLRHRITALVTAAVGRRPVILARAVQGRRSASWRAPASA